MRKRTDTSLMDAVKQAATIAAASEPVKRKRVRSAVHTRTGAEARAALVASAMEMWEAGDMSNAEPQHFVAVFAALYHRIYGVECMDLAVETKRLACIRAVRTMVIERFSGPDQLALYLAWVFQREAARVRGTKLPWRVGWNQVFMPGRLLEDYLLSSSMGKTA